MSTVAAYLAYFLAGYTGLTLALYAMSLVVPKAAFVARLLAFYMSMALCAIYGALASIVLRLAGRGGVAQWATARAFKYVNLVTTGVTFVVSDPGRHLDTTRPAVFIGNHQTELDVLMLGCMFPKYCSVTAKASLRNTPLLGWFMSLSGSIFIDRKNSRDAREAMRGAAHEITRRRQSVYMFPEGTRSYPREPTLLPFKKGAFHLAVEAQVPIVPVAVANYSHVLWMRGLVFNAGRIPVKVLDPIPTTGLTAADVEDLARDTHDFMLREITALTAQARGHPVLLSAASKTASNNGAAKATGAAIGSL